MKSIKEKSKEYADEQDIRMAYNGSCDNCRQGFVVGANYVLEQVENLVKTTIGDEEGYHYNLYIGLVNLLEQLKK